MKIYSFAEWHQKKLSEGERTISPAVNQQLQKTIDQINNQIETLNAQVQQLYDKRKRILLGMGGGYESGNLISGNEKQVGSNAKIGMFGTPYKNDYKQNQRKNRVKDAQQDLSAFGGNKQLYGVARKLQDMEPGVYRVAQSIGPQEAQQIVDYLVGDKGYHPNWPDSDYEQYSYDKQNHTIEKYDYPD